MTTGIFKMRCTGCKAKREITLSEAAKNKDVSFCPKCGAPEVVQHVSVSPAVSNASHRS